MSPRRGGTFLAPLSHRLQGPQASVRAASRRHASTAPAPSLPRRLLSTALVLGASGALVAYYYDSRSLMHEHVLMPVVRLFDAERGHQMAVRLLASGRAFRPRDMGTDGEELDAELFGLRLSNPVGMAAGFDKDAEAIDGLFDLGFGYVEVGSVTPEPQASNPKPRFFRLPEDQAAINRYGFNSLGHGHTLSRLRARVIALSHSHPSLFPSPLPRNPLPPPSLPRSLRPGHLLAVNLGKNKTSPPDSNDDYIKGMRLLGPYADVVVINVSSPNTPGLRALQGRKVLEGLLRDVMRERERIAGGTGLPKVAVKVACDLSEEEMGDVAAAVRASGVEGVIVSNTTVRREGLRSYYADEAGGLSGRPLFPHALHALRSLRPLLPPSIPIIGCGGIFTGSDAIAMASAGASLVQIYTSFGYRGVGAPRLLKDEISASLESRGTTWKDVIGRDWEGQAMGWNARRLQEESERLRREAEGLGDILRRAWEEEDMGRLVAEVERALDEGKVAVGEEGARDNLAGASAAGASAAGAQSNGTDVGQIEGAVRQAVDLVEYEAPEVGQRMTPLEIEFRRAVDSLMQPATDLGPVIVVEEVQAQVPEVREEGDAWRRSVRSGQRRLV